MRILFFQIIIANVILAACSFEKKEEPAGPVAIGLNGREFFEPQRSAKTQALLDSNLNVAITNWKENPSEENYIWYGRRLGYLSRFDESVGIMSEGLTKYPESYKLYRHRGHRYISMREFSKAIADLQQAAALMPEGPLEIEADGIPNKINTPLSSTQFNVWYHLGLAHYLKGDYESALKSYLQCLEVSVNDDLLCATTDWLYMTLRKLELNDEAEKILEPIKPEMTIIENDSYHKRLLMYKGVLPPDSVLTVSATDEDRDLSLATQGYGVGNWFLIQGDTTKAMEIFNGVISGNHFAAFGFIAAEAELHKLNKNASGQ